MGLFGGKTKDGNLKTALNHQSGLPGVDSELVVDAILDEDRRMITFQIKFYKDKPPINLPLSKITSTGFTTSEIVKEADAVGRAITGGLLFGSPGAIIGALTAKDKKKKVYYRVINYTSDEIEKSLIFKHSDWPAEERFFKKLNELLPPAVPETPDTTPIEL